MKNRIERMRKYFDESYTISIYALLNDDYVKIRKMELYIWDVGLLNRITFPIENSIYNRIEKNINFPSLSLSCAVHSEIDFQMNKTLFGWWF